MLHSSPLRMNFILNKGNCIYFMQQQIPSIATKRKHVMRKRNPIGCQTRFVWSSNITGTWFYTANIYVSTVNIPNLETHSYWAGISLQTLHPWSEIKFVWISSVRLHHTGLLFINFHSEVKNKGVYTMHAALLCK
jgi:hypothetical protein